MPEGSLSNYIGDFTSDHAYQSATATSYDQNSSPLVLTGMTWNLLNQCYAKNEKHEYSNNPFDLEESAQDYVIRKTKQLEFLATQLKTGSLDFMNLQEVDIFTQKPLPEFVTKFLTEIRKQGWKTAHTNNELHNVRYPLLTLYNTNKLELISTRVLLPTDNAKNCALEATFKYNGSDAQVCITNLDLDHTKDFRDDILKYQQNQVSKDIFTVMAGDVNHPKDLEPYNLTGDLTLATSIPSAKDGAQSYDATQPLAPLRDDGFMVSPPKNSKVEITATIPSVYFKVNPRGFFSQIINPDNAPIKYTYSVFGLDPKNNPRSDVSFPGQPYVCSTHHHLLVIPDSPQKTTTSKL